MIFTLADFDDLCVVLMLSLVCAAAMLLIVYDTQPKERGCV